MANKDDQRPTNLTSLGITTTGENHEQSAAALIR